MNMPSRFFKTATLCCALASCTTLAHAATQARPLTHGQPQLELVFVIDTTGSMGGLIDAAKQRVWQIVNNVMQSPGHPKVKLGLVAYRDHSDSYVTKVLPLTNDLDSVYTTLMSYQADGGGDTPEDVRQALADGVAKAGWSPRSSQIAQVLFLVGDAPPHNDYQNEPDTKTTTLKAVRMGLTVNTIECGSADDTRVAWQEIARHGEGEFFAIPQDGGVQVIATPYDKELASLGSKMGSVYTPYGFGGGAGGEKRRGEMAKRQSEIESSVTASAPMGAAADRAVNKAVNSEAYNNDLVNQVASGSVKIDAIDKDQLPSDLQKLSPEARKQEILRRVAERKNLQAKILMLSKKRDAYLIAQRNKTPQASKQVGFDQVVANALRKQAARKGIKF